MATRLITMNDILAGHVSLDVGQRSPCPSNDHLLGANARGAESHGGTNTGGHRRRTGCSRRLPLAAQMGWVWLFWSDDFGPHQRPQIAA
jgi:hypothetical protein